MKRCPFCAEELRDEAVLCRFCGATADVSKGTGAWRHLVSVIVYAWPTWERFTRAFPETAQRMGTVQTAATHVRDRFRTLLGVDSGPAPAPSSYVSGSGNNAHDMLMSLSEEYRAAILSQAVTSSGKPCPKGTQTFYQGFSSDLTAMWNVRCDNGRAYLVPFAADRTGSTKVLDCGVLNTIAPVECFVELK